ncbi:NADH-quinone oxidoreductase subunit M [Rhizobium bangladeshense]|uniref:NADH-quinone oxidoreductase subunit M n=1 Tax=Rhizobium bangladeshense TaxID=1138189 RepID=UPI001A993298|nr:NADH-quinone oxidoreductase subunit M [Rhizobium bangladeshense]MBX4899856.1 NADH-quinone oxidoreductase subunit M [Rhizobium bangladeshense]MBX4912058.1 NADH-quinone oxidoreductase subunit M [Rhizobium bangladeshense]MBX4933895.1 NADH-quinone oxidoreductase subunit M [Rhizobium bangladeshense]MBY3584555.1 NADH-quinone oxidoreductase subunit M [Rhizobium bangladeshense]QSY87886.1 NADH-quinone oxidoreductase subunit M [Rhizobium bangladeshense]
MGFPLLSVIIFTPVVGAAVLMFLRGDDAMRWTALSFTILDLALCIAMLVGFDTTTHAMQFTETRSWVPALGINYALGIDGISALFVFLTALLGSICVLASWVAIDRKVKEFMICLLFMQALMLGVFCALDLFLFYVFWEAMLIPMYLIIGVWGGEGRVYAAIKFFLYTLAGSLLFLIGVVVLYFYGGRTFDILALTEQDLPFRIQSWLFFAFLIAFAVKVPMVPLHTWLPDAHVQAPTAGSIILAGVLLKMGAYGFLRFSLPMLPEASMYYSTLMLALSVLAIVYGGLLALAQDDLKKLVAYSSISHMGFVTLGIFALNLRGLEGGILQMFNHGVTTGALFLFVGLIYERTHTRSIADYGGLMKVAPVYTTFLALFTLSSMALPGTNSFVGELLVLSGGFAANMVAGSAAVLGALLGAAYLLGMYGKIALGPAGVGARLTMSDVNAREMAAILPLAVFVLWVGLYPKPFLNVIDASVKHLLTHVHSRGSGP